MNETNEDILLEILKFSTFEVKFLSVLFFLIIFGNLFMIIRLYKRKKRVQMNFLCFKFNRISRMSFYIIFLSLADINVAFLSVFTYILGILNTNSDYKFKTIETSSEFSCKLVSFSQIFSVYISIYILVLMAHDRYLCICKPFDSINWNYETGLKNIFIIVLFAFCVSSPQFIFFKLSEFFSVNLDKFSRLNPRS